MRMSLLVLAMAVVPLTAFAQTAEETAALNAARERGRLLYAYDQAAWHGTDDMLKRIAKPQDQLGGWIVDGPADAAQLVFYDKDPTDPHAVYVASFKGGTLVSARVLGPQEDRALTAQRKRMIAATRTASAALVAGQVKRCSDKPFNTVVLPPAQPDGPISVYYLTPQADNNSLPFGGHYRIDVAADGTPGPVRAFTRSCLALPTNAPANADDTAAMVISHLLDPTPTEIHVFSSLAAHKPVFVLTGAKKAWAVDGDKRIRPLALGGK